MAYGSDGRLGLALGFAWPLLEGVEARVVERWPLQAHHLGIMSHSLQESHVALGCHPLV